MVKNILSVVAGLVAGFLIIYALEAVSKAMYPLPPFFDLEKADRETAKFFIDMIPKGAFLIVLLAFALGSLSGGLLSSVISERIHPPIIVGLTFMAASLARLYILPQPLWFIISSILIFLPFAFLGGKLGMKLKKKNKDFKIPSAL